MKISIRIYNLNKSTDITTIRNIFINEEGIVACEINKAKKEVQIVYDNLTISSEDIINLIEMAGYMVEN
ncbi:ferredoxin [Clostridium saudiense]|nr:ferredoxin [Clostridium saudiense]MBM6860643.1 ferredoxin [Clostridium saudiense]